MTSCVKYMPQPKLNQYPLYDVRENYKIVMKQLKSYVVCNRNRQTIYFAIDSILSTVPYRVYTNNLSRS